MANLLNKNLWIPAVYCGHTEFVEHCHGCELTIQGQDLMEDYKRLVGEIDFLEAKREALRGQGEKLKYKLAEIEMATDEGKAMAWMSENPDLQEYLCLVDQNDKRIDRLSNDIDASIKERDDAIFAKKREDLEYINQQMMKYSLVWRSLTEIDSDESDFETLSAGVMDSLRITSD